MNLIEPLHKIDYLADIIAEARDLVQRIPFENNQTQFSLQVKHPNESDWYTSCGRIQQGDKKINEEDFKYIQPELKGSSIEKWLLSFDRPIFRARLMVMNPRTTYSIHMDPTPRIHLPLITNVQCLMCFPRDQVMRHLQADGTSYLVNTTVPHTFMNCSTEQRIHIVASVENIKQ
jgi:hypothetical protein